MKVVIMAGGEGSRLRPLTSQRPKPLVPVATVPIMEHLVGLLREQGFQEFLVTTSYLAGEIQSHFGTGRDFGVSISYPEEPMPLGTAGAIKNASAELSGAPFLIVSGDALTDCDFTEAVRFHESRNAMVTLILKRVSDPLEFGVVVTDEDGRVKRLVEKPDWSEVQTDTVNTGMYIIDPRVLELMEAGTGYDWSMDIFPRLIAESEPVYGFVMPGFWCDVGSLSQYREAQEKVMSGVVQLRIPGAHKGGVSLGHGCQIDEQADLIPPVVLGENVKVKRGARVGPYTALGANCIVEEFAVVERSVVWENTYVGSEAQIRSAVLGAKVIAKRNVSVMEDAVVGDRCLLDLGAVVRPRVKIWLDKVVERGATVTMSMVWGHRWQASLFRDIGVAGISNIEMTPEVASRLAGAFGSLFPLGSTVVAARDTARSSRMLKRAMISSLVSVGCNVLDLRGVPLPVARYTMSQVGAAGSVLVRKQPGNRRMSLVELFDSRGKQIKKGTERKVEARYFREDFNRADAEDIGLIDYAQGAVESYLEAISAQTNMPSAGLRVACDYAHSSVGALFPSIAANLGIDTVGFHGHPDSRRTPNTASEIEAHLQELSHSVRHLNCDLGILFLHEGERFALVDDQGAIVDGLMLFALMAKARLAASPESSIAIPSFFPSSVAQWLESLGARVERVPNTARGLQHADIGFSGDGRGGFFFGEMPTSFDACFATAWLLPLLRAADRPVSQYRADLPEFAMAYDAVTIHGPEKGGVLRELTEQFPQDSSEPEGVRIQLSRGTALVTPDSFEPMFHVHAEGQTNFDCEEVAEEAVRIIQSIIARSKP
ncbi:MAG: hypothetical protein CBB60_007950 [Armatimonadetes bacterium Cent15-Ar3]|nr:MAG: hypothetical protein CBB60_007950 [Armatimonadetes bacterium Cent15-Ar3]